MQQVVVVDLQDQVLDGGVTADLKAHILGELETRRVVRPRVENFLVALADRVHLLSVLVAVVIATHGGHVAPAVPHALLTARLRAPVQQHMVDGMGSVGQKSHCKNGQVKSHGKVKVSCR